MAQSQQQTEAEKRAQAEKEAAEKRANAGERQTPGAHPDTTRTEETADQLARGVSPVSDDASADAEKAVADEPTPAATERRAAGAAPAAGSNLEDRVAALEADLAKVRLQLRHWL